MDEGDIAKFTDAIKEFDSMTHLVCSDDISFFFFQSLIWLVRYVIW
jgi:hypothetical protein